MIGKKATIEAKVPGAFGKKPAPKNVAIIQSKYFNSIRYHVFLSNTFRVVVSIYLLSCPSYTKS